MRLGSSASRYHIGTRLRDWPAPRRRYRPSCRADGAAGKKDRPPPWHKLQQTTAAMNDLVSLGDMFGRGRGPMPSPAAPDAPSAGASDVAGSGGGAKPPGKPQELRWAKYRTASSAGGVRVVLPSGALPGRTLESYLKLPTEQYSVLDPKWVERLPDGAFRMAVPLEVAAAGGAALRPSICVHAGYDAEAKAVVLRADRASLGEPSLDGRMTVDMRVTVGWKPAAGKNGGTDDGGPWVLDCAVTMEGGLQVPALMAFGGILGGTLSGVLGAATKAMLPRFVAMLAEDYGRWALGSDRTAAAGSLDGSGGTDTDRALQLLRDANIQTPRMRAGDPIDVDVIERPVPSVD